MQDKNMTLYLYMYTLIIKLYCISVLIFIIYGMYKYS